MRSRAPADKMETSPTDSIETPPDGSARTTRGLGGYTRGCADAHPPSKTKIPRMILPELPEGSVAPVGFINPVTGFHAKARPKQAAHNSWAGPRI